MRAKVEQVTYDPGKMLDATKYFARNCLDYSGYFETMYDSASFLDLNRIITNQEDRKFVVIAGGMEVGFSGIPQPKEQKIGGKLVYSAEEPHFWIKDTFDEYYNLPSEKNAIDKVTHAIFSEMEEVCKMEPDNFNKKLVFPKEEFGKEIAVFEAVLLG